MLNEIIKRESACARHRATLFGSYLEDYLAELSGQGYMHGQLRSHLNFVTLFGEYLSRRRIGSINEIRTTHVSGFISTEKRRRKGVGRAAMISRIQGSIRVFLQVMQTKGIMKTEPTLKTRSPINDFLQGLAEDRGLHAKTIGQYRNSLNQFLQHIEFDDSAGEMLKLTTKDIDKFIVYAGRKYGRSSMRAICTALRGLLRYLHESSLLPHDLSLTVTMPMFYALERLPCAVPWKIINSLLEFPNKKTDAGKRDHAILQLLIAYGIRPGELVRLHLVDVNWRREQICFSRSKPGRVLRFPLTRDVGEAILSYLRNGRPTTSQSNLFMTARAPYVPLSAKAVYSIVQKYVEKAGIDARIKGPYLIRHSLAVNLIRQGQPLKTITDILGHRDPHVAYHYTKLATEDLRDVALSVKEVLP